MMRQLSFRIVGPVLIPVIWCLAVLWIMHPDAIATRPNVPFTTKWLLTDVCDLTALSLRGANHASGRLPGRLDEPDWNDRDIIIEQLDEPQPPLSDRYYLEYPLLDAFLFRAAFPTTPDLPPVVADGFQYGVSLHIPRTDAERQTWRSLRGAVRTYIVTFLVLLLVLYVVLGIGYQPGESWNGWVWILALPGCCYFTLHRFDIAPTLAMALAFAALGRQRIAWAGFFLGVGVSVKIFPVILAPVIVRYLGIRKGTAFSLAFAATIATLFGISGLLTDWASVIGPIRVQLSRTLEIGWTNYGFFLPLSLGNNGPLRLGILSAIILACSFTIPRDLDSVLRRCGIILTAFVFLAVFWSPQWFIWFLPILIPLARRNRWFGYAAIAIDLTNYFSFPILFWILYTTMPLEMSKTVIVGATIFRGLLWLGLAALLAPLRSPSARATLDSFLPNLPALIVREGNRRGIPKGLTWQSCEPAGAPIQNGEWAFVPLNASFEPIPGSEMETVAAAKLPRPIVAIVRLVDGEWRLDRPPVFNLSAEELSRRITQPPLPPRSES